MRPILRRWRAAYGRDGLVLLLFFILPLWLFGDVTLGGQTMLPVDNLFQWEPWRTHAAEFGVTTPQNNLLSDLILENYPWKRFIRASLEQGELPLWNPYIFAGAPFLANGQHAAYYPFSLLFLSLPLPAAYGWYTVSQLWLAGVGMYVFGRILGQRRSSAFIAGLVYQGCGFMLVSAAVFPMIIGAAAWLPLLLAALEMVIRRAASPYGAGQTLPWAVAGALGLGIHILAGHIEITYYTLLILAAWSAWRLAGQARRAWRVGGGRWAAWQAQVVKPAAWLLSVVAVGIMLGAIQIVPFYEVGQTNFRQSAATLSEVRGWAFPLRRVVTFALPNFFGNPAHHTYTDFLSGAPAAFGLNAYGRPNPHGAGTSNWGIKNYVEGGIYFGILPLLLAAWGAWAGLGRHVAPLRRRQVAFFVGLAFLSVNFIFGSPLYAGLYYGLPFINQLHSPFRWAYALSLCVAALAGFGAEAVAERRAHGPSRPWLWHPGWWLAGGAVLAGALALARPFYARLEPGLTRLFWGLAQAPDAFPDARAFFSYLYPQLLVLSGLLLATGLVWYVAWRTPRWVWLAAVLLVVDVWAANRGFHAAVDPALLDFKPELVRWLEQQPGAWRLTTFEAHGDKPFNANSGWLFNLQDVRGYDSIIARQYTNYMQAIEQQTELPFNRVQPIKTWQALNSPLLDMLGVRYIITAETLDLPKLRPVWQGEGLRVYENLAAVSRAYALPASAARQVEDALPWLAQADPRQYLFVEGAAPAAATTGTPRPGVLQPAQITGYSGLEVSAEISLDTPAWLVLNDSYQPGWKAFARPAGSGTEAEQELPIYRVNGNFRGVYLPTAGDYSVRWRYSPLTFKLGGLISFMAGIILAFALGVWLWRRYYRLDGALSATQSVAKNSLAPMALNLFNKLIDFVFAAFYLRVLGPAESGAYATAIAIVLWFEIVANWGLNTFLIREVSQDRSRAGHYLWNSTVLRAVTTLIGALPVLVYVGAVSLTGNPLSADILLAIGLLALGMVFSGMGQGVAGLFYAYESAEYPAAIATVTTILKVAFGVAVLLLGSGYLGLAAISILVNIITLGLLIGLAFRLFPLRAQPWQVDWALQRRMLAISYPLMLNHLLATVFWQIDVPLLRQYNGEAVVGWYNAAYKWVNAFNVIPSFFTFALFPILSRQALTALDDARRTYRLSVKLLVLVALPLAALVTWLANSMIGALGGAEFLPDGAIALRLVIWSIPIGWINSVTNYMIISLGLERRLTLAFILGVGFNLIANLIFLPRYSYVAASLVTILSEVVLLLAFNRFLRRRLPPVEWGRLLWRPALAGLLMLGGLWLSAKLHLLAAVVLGLGIYVAAAWVLRVFSPDEQKILAALAPEPIRRRWLNSSQRL